VMVDDRNTISFRAAASGVSVNLATGTATSGALGSSLVNKRNVVGSPYDDTLTGDDHANRLTGGRGADTLAGGAGNDVYGLGYGDGVDLVHDDHRYPTTSTHQESCTYEVWVEWNGGEGSSGYWETRTGICEITRIVDVQDDAGEDSLAFAAGISAADIWVKREDDDLVVGIAGAGATNPAFDGLADRVRLKDWANVKNRIETLRFGDGSTMDMAILYPRLGSEPWNLAVGVDDDETLTGTAGDDTFFFRRGDGNDVVTASNTTAATDRVVFGGAIDPDQLWLTRRNDDLDVAVVGEGGRLTLRDWYVNTARRIDEFRVADGRILVESHVQQLVNAMAAFDPPAGSDVRIAPAVREQLEPTLAASWQRPTT
jgi:Ca2+-binding RTX toxin-like protein